MAYPSQLTKEDADNGMDTRYLDGCEQCTSIYPEDIPPDWLFAAAM